MLLIIVTEFGHLSFVICHWSLVIGHWSLVICHWAKQFRVLSEELGVTNSPPASSPSSPLSPLSLSLPHSFRLCVGIARRRHRIYQWES
ncbi:hypothetical protein [Nostoc sp. CALU 1950]|uniref:hypothetical protein n=1 Tax=Nostoc sp. CALU 1950 TaxID=3104321 RepID=UPI003EB8B0C8